MLTSSGQGRREPAPAKKDLRSTQPDRIATISPALPPVIARPNKMDCV